MNTTTAAGLNKALPNCEAAQKAAEVITAPAKTAVNVGEKTVKEVKRFFKRF